MRALFLFFILLVSVSCTTVQNFIKTNIPNINSSESTSITTAEMTTALKEALTEGIISSTDILSKENGYYGNSIVQILLPPEAEPIINSINMIPGGEKLIENVIVNINRSAEDAAGEVLPIFESAITSMTITDAINILKGSDTAATEYFKGKTYNQIKSLYASKINTSLDKPFILNTSANSSWKVLVDANNEVASTVVGKLAGMTVVEDGSLGDYATGKALDGLFFMVGEEEKKIRDNPLNYAEEMIQKVFGALLNGTL